MVIEFDEYSSFCGSKVFFSIVTLEFLRQVQNILQRLLSLLVIFLELFRRDQRLRLLLYFPDSVEANQDQDEINGRINDNEIDHIDIFLELINISVEANIVQQDDQERVQRADWMIRLHFRDVNFVVAHDK